MNSQVANRTPRLVAIAGAAKGQEFALAEGDTTIGREATNGIAVADISMSRRHSLLKHHDGEVTVHDLGSLNGTFVNGLPVNERALRHGDQIKIGYSAFLFIDGEDAPPPISSEVQFDDVQLLTQPTAMLRREDALYVQASRVQQRLKPSERVAQDLAVLLNISAAISSIRGLEALQKRLLELVFEVIPAERGAILLTAGREDGFASVFGLDRVAGTSGAIQISRTVVQQVSRESVGLIRNDVLESSDFDAAHSLLASRTRALLCVPLTVFDSVTGVLYLDTANRSAQFDEDHLQLATGIAAIAALALDQARRVEWLESENERLQADIRIEHSFVGESRSIREVYQFIAKVAPTDSTVLIRGESGTGKELVARALHTNSGRADQPFVAINCAALTEPLLESEIFGHEKGAFTGAVAQKKGKLEIANGGTLFLDEVGELAPTLQAKLLRVLQEREFERVGGTRPIKVDIRLLAATNRDLEAAIKSGDFRQDLFYRLNVVAINLPPLRERREDIALLAGYFAMKYSVRVKRPIAGITAAARACLTAYDWPGNVRELENAIERAVVLGSTELITVEDLPEALIESKPVAADSLTNYHDALNELKKQLIRQAVEQADGNYTEAAKYLGLHPNYLHRLIRNLNLKSELTG